MFKRKSNAAVAGKYTGTFNEPSIGSSETVVEPPANLFPHRNLPFPFSSSSTSPKSIIMFAARRSVNLFQKRAFSASASNVRITRSPILAPAYPRAGLQGRRSRCCRWYWPAALFAAEAQPPCYQPRSLRYSRWTR